MKPPTDEALFRRIFYSIRDVSEARMMLHFAESEITEIRQEHRGRLIQLTRLWGLYCSAVVAYCRPFKASRDGEFAAQLLPEDEFELRIERSDLLDTHRRIIATRDRLIAHGDPHVRRLAVSGTRAGSDSLLEIGLDTWPRSLDDLEIPAFRTLVDRVLRLLSMEWLGDIRDRLPSEIDLPPSPKHRTAPWEPE